jgi:hypothetical protein
MHHTIFIVSLLVFFGNIGGSLQRPSSPSTSTNTDAKDITELVEKLFSLASKEEKAFTKLECQIAKQCCQPKAYKKLFSILSKDNVTKNTASEVGTVCLNTPARDVIAKKCPLALKLTPSSGKKPKEKPVTPEIAVAALKIMKHGSIVPDFGTDVEHSCNPEEIYAFNCVSNQKVLQSCIGKVIQAKTNPRNKNANPEYAKKLKAAMTDMYQFMKIAF